MVKVAPKEDDKIPLLEYDDGSRPVERRRHRPEMTTNVDVTHPVQPETVAHLVQPDDTLEVFTVYITYSLRWQSISYCCICYICGLKILGLNFSVKITSSPENDLE